MVKNMIGGGPCGAAVVHGTGEVGVDKRRGYGDGVRGGAIGKVCRKAKKPSGFGGAETVGNRPETRGERKPGEAGGYGEGEAPGVASVDLRWSEPGKDVIVLEIGNWKRDAGGNANE